MLKTDSSYGTAPAAAMTDGRPIISKTGTTSGSKSAFFIGAIPQNVLAVGIFTAKQSNTNNAQTLEALGGGGFGGSWPAAIWHSFAEARWASDPIQNFLNPVFTGQAWIQVPKAPAKPKPKPKPTPTQTPGKGKHHGGFPLPTTAPTSSPNPAPTCSGGLFGCSTQQPNPSPSATTSSPPPTTPVKRHPGG
jgi:membrane peptidoglycan carboxypeptidase